MSHITLRALLVLALSATAPAAMAEVLAEVNGESITSEQVNQFLSMSGSSAGQLSREQVLQEMITRELLLQDAKKRDLEDDAEVQRQLELARRNILINSAIQTKLKEDPAKESELRAAYDDLKESMSGTQYKARHILVKDEQTAQSIIEQLNEGADFSELARDVSIDPSGKQSGGDLGWFMPQQMVPAFGQAVQQLEKGKYTTDPVQSQYGWHVILLEDSRPAEPPAFEQVKPNLEQMLRQRKVQAYLSSLRQNADIEIKQSGQ